MLLAYLGLPRSKEDERPFKKWAEMGHDLGITFEYPYNDWEEARRVLEKADAFYVQHRHFLEPPDLAETLHRRVAEGARVIVQPNVFRASGNSGTRSLPELEWWNAFLGRYDLGATTIQITSQKRTANIRFTRDADSYRDLQLLADVDNLVIDQPYAVWYGGEALPVVVASAPNETVDWVTDFPSNWNGRELACVALWKGTSGAVLYFGGRILHDPPPGYRGKALQGIGANSQFAKNVLGFLSEGPRWPSPEECCRRIEVNLVDFVLDGVKADPNWWENCIPAQTRKKCDQRWANEGSRFPKEAYFDLLDLKKIMEMNWTRVEPYLRVEGKTGSKEQALAWVDQLNELRRFVGHPLKVHVSGYTFSQSDSRFLSACDDLTRRLRKRLRP